jgi:hypothetical protein
MDAARGPHPSLGANRQPTHDTLGHPGKQLGQSCQRSSLPAALVPGNTAGSLAGGGFA